MNALTAYDLASEFGKPIGKSTREMFDQDGISSEFELQTACYPSLKVFADNPYNNFFVASVLLGDGDTFENVAHSINVGQPNGVVWSASVAGASVNNNEVRLPQAYDGELTLTATCGAASRSFNLTIVQQTGINDTKTADDVTSATYYDMRGAHLGSNRPQSAGIYIVSEKHRSGATTARKVVVR